MSRTNDSSAPPPRYLSREALARLERLRLRAVRGAAATLREGDSRGAGRGGFAEFVDHRAYAPGDDLRRIDWALYARRERLYVKEFGRETEPEEWIVVDSSASMATPASKAEAARRLAFALSFVALRGSRTVRLAAAGGSTGFRRHRPLVSRSAVFDAARRAADLEFDAPGGAARGDLARDVRRLREAIHGPAGVTVVSDLLFPGEEATRELRGLRAAGHAVTVLQLLSREDVSLGRSGRIRFRGVEAEDSSPVEIVVDRAAAERFERAASEFVARWRRVLRAHGIVHVVLRSDAGEDEFLFRGLKRAGVLVGAGRGARSRG